MNFGWATRGASTVDANFASDDGSVKRYDNISMIDGYSDQTYMYHTGQQSRQFFLLPVDQAK